MQITVTMTLEYRGGKKPSQNDLDTIQGTIVNEIENGGLDFTIGGGNRPLIGSVTLATYPDGESKADKEARKLAKVRYHREGEIEIDDNAKVSRAEGNPDRGAYVEAWVWIPDQKGGN